MIWIVVFLGLFYAIGLGLLGSAAWSAYRSTRAGGWPVTEGTIESVTLDEDSDSDGATLQVKVQYSYTVAGKAYEGTRLAFGYTGSSGREGHDAIYSKLKNAKAVAVRYDPADPAVSALSFGVHRSIQFLIAFALTWLAFIVGFTVLFWLGAGSDTVLLENLSVQ